jgi:hypothetical protein
MPTPAATGAADVARCVWSLATWLWPIPAAVAGLALRRSDTQVQQQALLDGVHWRMCSASSSARSSPARHRRVLAMQEFAVYEPTGISVVADRSPHGLETGRLRVARQPHHRADGSRR